MGCSTDVLVHSPGLPSLGLGVAEAPTLLGQVRAGEHDGLVYSSPACVTPPPGVKVKPVVMPASFNFALRSNLVLTSGPWLQHALAQRTRAGFKPSAVSAFNRLPFLLQAAARRCLAILCSFYFDDATAQDFDFCAADSQSMLEECVSLLGYAFAEAKRQTPSSQGDFLGIVHDLKDSLRLGRIPLWIRPRLIDKICDLMDTAEPTIRSLPLGQQAFWLPGVPRPGRLWQSRSYRAPSHQRTTVLHRSSLSPRRHFAPVFCYSPLYPELPAQA